MADTQGRLAAQVAYETVCRALEKHDWKFKRHDDALVITCGARGDDLEMDFVIMADADRQVLSILSPMPFQVSEDKRMDVAIAVTMANNGMVMGCFDYDIADGKIRFRMNQSFYHSQIGEDLAYHLVMLTSYTVDHYNDKFLSVSTGVMSLEAFIDWENEK